MRSCLRAMMRPTLVGLFLGGLGIAGAAEPPARLPEGVLTLERAVQLGLAHHPGLDRSRSRVAEAEASIRRSTADYRPRLYAEGVYRQGRQAGGDDEGEFSDDSEARLTLEQEIYDFGGRAAARRAARRDRGAAQLTLFDARQKRVLAIRRAFYDVLLAERQTQIWNEAMAVAFVRFDYGQGREELGDISPVDKAQRESRFRRLRGNYREAQWDAREARVELGHAMGLTDAIPGNLADPDLALDRELPEVKDLRDRAWEANPRLRAARRKLQAARAGVAEARGQLRPRIVAEITAKEEARQSPYANTLEAGIRLEAPLYEGGDLRGAVDEARARLLQERARVRELRQTVEENVYDAWLDVRTWREKRAAAEVRLEYRKLATDLARTEYMLELATDLGDALTNQTRAERDLAKARFGLALAFDRLDALTGVPLAAGIEPPNVRTAEENGA